ncbi:hypothetical protein L226DRAFT_613237, partial [Lentinus tigrinus ALCF2SS1-7]|uniref:RRM domain-containing protein n=1 Tax=Lentinus tigrinus ALCF2SS1-6 TaxID=1328759 RepID=A0A5C2SDT3_9APHY
MTRFRCPSASSISSSGSMTSVGSSQRANSATPVARMPSIAESPNHPGPAARTPAPARKLDKGKGRARTPGKMDLRKRESLRMSMKKAEVKNRQFSFVYVGNLGSDVIEQDLEEKFRRCGPIRLIQMRASSGLCVPTLNLPGPFFGFLDPPEARHYATIEFLSPLAARKALEFNGVMFAGREMIVSFSALDLPETTEILKGLVEKKQQRRAPPPVTTSLAELRTLWKIKFGQIKRLTIEKTEYVADPYKAPAPRGQLVSRFAKRVGLLPDSDGTTSDGHSTLTYPQTIA